MKKLDIKSFLVLGEGLAAGMTNFSLIEPDQRDSFPAQMAKQMNTGFVQPLMQAPGIGDAPGFPRLPVRLPLDLQTTVLSQFPPSSPHSNLSIPGMKLADALTRRPVPPLICRSDAFQTAVNLILGMPGLLLGDDSLLPSQLEYALGQKPTLAIIELGFVEALEAAVAGKPELLPDAATFRANYSLLVKALRSVNCEVIALTVPNPTDTAHFSPLDAAARVLKVPAPMISTIYGLQPNDRVTVDGLTEMGYQLICKSPGPLRQGSIIPGEAAAAIGEGVSVLNREIAAVARELGAEVYDLHGLFRTVRGSGIEIGGKKFTADFLGGFYSLNGYYPGKTGHALIANGVLDLINRTYGTAFPLVDAAQAMQADAVAKYEPPQGPDFSPADLAPPAAGAPPQPAAPPAPVFSRPVPGADPKRAGKLPLTLPPGLEQVLPLNKESSYYGDALRPVHTTDPAEAFYGLSGNLLFGGLAMLDSHLSGYVRIKFSPPVDNISHFEVSHGEGLIGDDARLSAPQFYKLPALQHKVFATPDVISSGDLDLTTGYVANLRVNLFFMNSAIFSLAQVNPTLPREPIHFPGQYGTTWAKFEQRADGLLDYTFYGTTFIPLSVLGTPVRFPFPFVSPTFNFASIPSDGTALHPHIHLSTKAPEPADPGKEVPEFPTNTICEFLPSIHNNSFGDDFTLNAPELGGPATGRSHLAGRFQIQFGERFGDTIPIAVFSMPPGGQLANIPQSPIAQAFQKRIPDGLQGHDEFLTFPKSDYRMDMISFLDDPLDIALAAVNVKTGKIEGHLLWRGMITTSWILAMIQVEPRTPKSTFTFRGPASFEKGTNGETIFKYDGSMHIPFPEGFFFPASDLKTGIVIGPNSALDPFLHFQAMAVPGTPRVAKAGGASKVKASFGDEFSYSYSIPAGSEKPSFEYVNHTKGGTFKLQSLTWVGHLNSKTSTAPAGDFDTLTFTGFGSWSKDATNGPHVVAVQICTSERYPYVSIQIDGGWTSNVNTMPPNIADTLP